MPKTPEDEARGRRLHDFWTRQAKRKSLRFPTALVAETLVSAGLSALVLLYGKREVARRLGLMAAHISLEAGAEEAESPP